MEDMEFGVVVGSFYSANGVLSASKVAEENGLDYFFVTDHYMTPVSNSTVDAWVILSAVAAITLRIRIGTCVTPIPFRPPAQLAKIVATVDQVSGGRAILGVGSGWHEPEFSGYSSWDEDGRIRARKTREALDLISKLWDKEKNAVDFKGKYYSASRAVLEPKPVQNPCVPLWFGTRGDYMLKIAARMAQGWLPGVPGVSLDEYRRVISTLRQEEKRIGREDRVKVACNGAISELNSNLLEQYAKEGCEIALLVRSREKSVESEIGQFAKEVIPSFKKR
jgi:alkanesulfonate monooxygenase SsuD/methylene tetrahydromethanopterin reductase-like flavin-dependent oxidoreductase (luciferase family)